MSDTTSAEHGAAEIEGLAGRLVPPTASTRMAGRLMLEGGFDVVLPFRS
ncbi:MAG TPA: hypothetical protein VIT41_01440 [Microlunatus sp.]